MVITTILLLTLGNVWFLYINWFQQKKINEKLEKLLNNNEHNND